MTKFRIGTPGPRASGDANESAAPANTGTADTHATSVPGGAIRSAGEASAASGDAATSQTARGSWRLGQWVPPAGGSTRGTDPATGVRARMGKKSAWTLGGIIAVAALAVVLSAVAAAKLSGSARLSALTGGTPPVPTSSASLASPGSGAIDPIAGASHTAGKTRSGAPARTAQGSPPPVGATAIAGAATGATTKAEGAPVKVSMPSPVSFWLLNDDTGTTARDAMGVHPAVGSNTAWCTYWKGQCANFNGTDSEFATSGPVIDTAPGSSFTVSVWVDMTAFPPSGTFSTIVSQDGTYDSGFYLQYSPNDRWAFSRSAADTDTGSTGIRALSSSTASLNYWTHLVGVFDASDNQLRLYVDGVLQGTATDSSPFAAAGDLAIGRAQYDGKPIDWFTGSADQVKVFNVALTTAQVDNT
jgi:hypothetical protein